MKNKKVLLISYHFPPEGGPAVQRISKFAKYLPEFNFEPYILTTYPNSINMDHSLLDDLSPSLEIFRVRDYGKFIPGEIRNIFSNIFLPDKTILWRLSLIKRAISIIKKNKIDLIFATVPPHSIGYIASIISKRANVPLILDFRDEWITFPLFNIKKHQKFQKELFQRTMKNCKAITVVCETLKDRILNNNGSKINKPCKVIYNGFDFSDIPPERTKNSNKIIICYNGRFKKVADPKIFFQSMEKLLNKKILDKNLIEFVVMGNQSNEKWIKDFPKVKKITKFTGYVSLKESYKIIQAADVGLLLLTNYGESSALPLKMFDYIALGKPIIAFVEKEDELTDFLKKYNATEIYLISEFEKFPKKLEIFLKQVKQKRILYNSEYKKIYNRKKQTEELAKFFSEIIINKETL